MLRAANPERNGMDSGITVGIGGEWKMRVRDVGHGDRQAGVAAVALRVDDSDGGWRLGR